MRGKMQLVLLFSVGLIVTATAKSNNTFLIETKEVDRNNDSSSTGMDYRRRPHILYWEKYGKILENFIEYLNI